MVLAALILLWPQVQQVLRGQLRLRSSFEPRGQIARPAQRRGLADDRQLPITGTGLNNFTQIEHRYTTEPLLFPGFPSHNLFILTAAETGVLGLAGLLIIGAALAWNAIRLGQVAATHCFGRWGGRCSASSS